MSAFGGKRTSKCYARQMHSLRMLLGLFFCELVVACASTSSRVPDHSISVSTRTTFMVCTGVCPNYNLTVWPDGRVLVVRHFTGDADEVKHFRVSPSEAAQFAHLLLPYRPSTSLTPDSCRHSEPSVPPFSMEGADLEITWLDEHSPTRLGFCLFAWDDELAASYKGPRPPTRFREVLRQALWSIHLFSDATSPDGPL